MLFLKIKIVGSLASLFLAGESGRVIDSLNWIDNRDLSEKLLKKIDKLLKRNNLTTKDIFRSDFYCDSPYRRRHSGMSPSSAPLESPIWTPARLSESSAERLRHGGEKNFKETKLISSKGKCGFMSWQIGEVTTRVLNF